MIPQVVAAIFGRPAPPATHPADDAISGGAAAADVAGAFLSGYLAALRALVPDLPAGRRVCLCATEAGGAHPKQIASTIRDGRLDGKKTWVTGAPLADLLLVLASEGTAQDGRKLLRLALVDARAPGVTLHPMPPTPFVPEIPHAEVSFAGVRVERLLDGDGWNDYVKPFRTVEDAHVFAAVLAYVARTGVRHGWPRELAERFISLLTSLRAIAEADPRQSATHLALAGALSFGRTLLAESAPHWSLAPEKERAAWERDRALLEVAGRARVARAEAAWSAETG
jgi:alkylation response protein AidB-like acyl-CoA dehydrogenase